MEKMKSLDVSKTNHVEFVRDAEGAELARMSVATFRRLAEEFDAVYRIGRTRVTDWNKFKQGLEVYKG